MGSTRLIDVIISWVPMILLIAVWVIYMRRYQGKNSPQHQLIQLYGDHLVQAQQTNKILARIATALERDRDNQQQHSTVP